MVGSPAPDFRSGGRSEGLQTRTFAMDCGCLENPLKVPMETRLSISPCYANKSSWDERCIGLLLGLGRQHLLHKRALATAWQ